MTWDILRRRLLRSCLLSLLSLPYLYGEVSTSYNGGMKRGALSTDGYLINQNLVSDMPYGHLPSDVNGCGWIALYNLERSIGRKVSVDDVYKRSLAILPFRGILGSPMHMMKRYLKENDISFHMVYGKKALIRASGMAKAGIIRYIDGYEPHYVAFRRIGKNRFRFYNAIPGMRRHDRRMEEFLSFNARLPFVRTFLVNSFTSYKK